jgi:glutamate/tyrosine decarboxylase-like PLP-dependent enzyme
VSKTVTAMSLSNSTSDIHKQSTDDPFADAEAVLERAASVAKGYLATLPTRTVAREATPAEMGERLNEPLPDVGVDPASLPDEWFARAEHGIVATSGPRFFGWVLGGSTPASIAGDWIASAIDQNTGGWPASPAGVQTEIVVIDWLKELFGLPKEWAGVLTTGGSMSNLVGLTAARQWISAQLGFDAARDGLAGQPALPVISSTEIHASALKALGILGIGRNSVHFVPAHDGVIDLAVFEQALAAIEGPAIVVANAGEVNTGAFDDIEAMARICRAHPHGAWLHVDGAFGTFAAVSPRTRNLLNGIELADSLAADGHKWLNVPNDSGFAFVRDQHALESAFTVSAAYILVEESDTWDPVRQSRTPELSRRARGLALWFGLKALGRQGVQEIVERCLDHTIDLARWIDAQPMLERCADVHLNIACFRYRPSGLDTNQLDAFNRAATLALQRDGRVFVSDTEWQGNWIIRVAFDNWSTRQSDVELLKEVILDIGSQLLTTPAFSTNGHHEEVVDS